MRLESSELAQLVIAYREKFGRYVPAPALLLNARDLARILQNSLATGTPLSETEWGPTPPMEFSPRGCIVREPEPAAPKKGPDGEWLQ
jgi:hypothetical protein